MILIVGKYVRLAECLAEKFRKRRYDGDVLVKSSTRLIDFLNVNADHIEILIFLDKQYQEETDPSRLDHLQLMWTTAARYSIPVLFMFFKFYKDSSLDLQVDKYISWTEKQYRKPPVYYLFKIGELYGLGDGESIADECIRNISETGVVSIVRYTHGTDTVERQLDYVYINDVMRVFYWFVVHHPESGEYDLGSGFSRTDTAVANAVFRATGLPKNIKYVENVIVEDMSKFPVEEMNLSHLRRVGYKKSFYSIEKGVKSCVKHIL